MRMIRDRLAGIDSFRTRPATEAELRHVFSLKLQEELEDYFEAVDAGESITLMQVYLGNLLEVVHSLIRNQGYSPKLVGGVASRKRKIDGDYDRAIVWLTEDEEV